MVFEKEGVFMHTDSEIIDGQDSLTSGRLQVIDKVRGGTQHIQLNNINPHPSLGNAFSSLNAVDRFK